MIKNLFWIAVVAVIGILLWQKYGKEWKVAEVIENGIDKMQLALDDAATPESDDTENHLVIRREMLEQRKKDDTEWTAVNRQAHPELYLQHCARLLDDYSEKYQVAIMSSRTLQHKCRRELEEMAGETASDIAFLQEAKNALSDNPDAFPKSVKGITYASKESLARKVRNVDKRLNEIESLKGQRVGQLERLEITLAELIKGRDNISEERKELEQKIEQLRERSLKSCVDAVHESMNSLLGGADAVMDEMAKSGVRDIAPAPEKSLDDIFREHGIK